MRPPPARSSTRSPTGATPTTCSRPNGAEAPDYRAAGLKYGPSNAPFETVGELARVLGMTPASFRAHRRRAHRVFAPARHQPRDRVARRAARAAQRDARDGRRVHRRSATQALASQAAGAAVPAGAGIRRGRRRPSGASARGDAADGVTFVREAVVRPSPDAQRPLIVLAWLEGVTRRPHPPLARRDSDAPPSLIPTLAQGHRLRWRDLARRAWAWPGSGRWWLRELAALVPARAVAPRIERAPDAAGDRVRRRRGDAVAARAERTAACDDREAARIALDGDAASRRGRGAQRRSAPLAGNGAAAARSSSRSPPRACCARRLTLPAARRRQPAPDARLRSRPPYAVQGRRALLRRRDRRPRSGARNTSPSISPRCAARWSTRCCATPRASARDVVAVAVRFRRRTRAASPLNLLPARPRSVPVPRCGRAGSCSLPLRSWWLVARRARPAAVAEARIRDRAQSTRRRRRASAPRCPTRCAPSSSAWSATTTSRSSASTRFPASCRCSTT